MSFCECFLHVCCSVCYSCNRLTLTWWKVCHTLFTYLLLLRQEQYLTLPLAPLFSLLFHCRQYNHNTMREFCQTALFMCLSCCYHLIYIARKTAIATEMSRNKSSSVMSVLLFQLTGMRTDTSILSDFRLSLTYIPNLRFTVSCQINCSKN